ncbi:hypothetical protein CONPUDRAFT_80395 [Coniophora puteana RWD-64-598 SS2]|uniref:F-box domain-containing protein n=1 Tax=Coniophora puteana (strain RWD-64-598) TaxID=741705 RepID=A0A5M3MXM5_CONPW|nr:uncharacterized protein CONPUDRAFT_80395 [Coniophora puteana RWD-64-598 SS2]EIW83850.1 hypothetical protein CONPUDRAFT_80395 [Coniophora puteana RWD-64-598 SS2]
MSTMRALAMVCRRWLDVLAMRPEYWEQLKINIDGPTFIPAAIETFFVASRDNPIEVTVYPREFEPCTLTAAQERDRWALIMRHMAPHLGRLSRLSVTTYFRSTIVFISQFLDGATLTLEELELKSRQTDDTSPLQISTLRMADIESLHTDAESFVNLMGAIEWLSGSGTLGKIGITGYRPESPLPAASPARLIAALDKLNGLDVRMYILSITNVKFDPNDLPSDTPSLRSVALLTLEELEGPFVPIICDATRSSVHLEDIHVEKCETPTYSPLPPGNLNISGIPSGPSLLHLLQGFEGTDIILYDCQGFDDWFLGVLSVRNQTDGRFQACPNLQNMELRDYHFSASALRRMCEARYDNTQTRIKSLSVYGPKLDDESNAWLESHVEDFSWEERELSELERLRKLQELLSSMGGLGSLIPATQM